MGSSIHNLEFLKEKTTAFYSGLDYRAFPSWDKSRKFSSDYQSHIVYMKVLALLVDHIAIPPAFIVSAIMPKDKNETFLRDMLELFQTNTFVTAVHEKMNDPEDFYWYKLEHGDAQEKTIFNQRKREATLFFKQIPLLHRSIPKMSGAFKELLMHNLQTMTDKQLPSEFKEKIEQRVIESEVQGEVALSRMTFIRIVDGLRLNRYQKRACHYAMNSAYYMSGATTYHSDIACLDVEKYSVFRNLFENEENRIVVGYDPSLFLRVLETHDIDEEVIYALNPEEIQRLKQDERFVEFTKLYRAFVLILQSMSNLSAELSTKRIRELRDNIIDGIQKRFNTETRMNGELYYREDVGTGFLTATLGVVLGTLIVGYPGIIASGLVGGIGPILKALKISLVEGIAERLHENHAVFSSYIEYLHEELRGYPKKNIGGEDSNTWPLNM